MKRNSSQFELTIELGNDLMRTPQDVAAALRAIAKKLEREPAMCDTFAEPIRDLNGNTVGSWSYTNDDEGTR